MDSTPSTKAPPVAEGERRNYGDTIVGNGAYAHLGDLLQQLNVEGGLSLNFYSVRRPVVKLSRIRGARKEHQESLRWCHEVLAAIAKSSDEDLRHTRQAAARCVRQLARKTVEDVDVFLRDNNTQRRILSTTRNGRGNVQRSYQAVGRRGTRKVLRSVEERLDMIESLLAAYNTGTSSDVDVISDSTSDEAANIHSTSTTEQGHRSIVVNLKLVLILPSLDLSLADLNAILDKLRNEVIIVGRLFNAILSLCVMKLAWLGPQLVLFWHVLRFPRMLSAGNATFCNSAIRPEDAIWLLNATTRRLELFHKTQKPKYAILSSQWDSDGAHFDNPTNLTTGTANYRKFDMCCRLALARELNYVWIDRYCFRLDSRMGSFTAMNNIVRWYIEAAVCFRHVSNVTELPSGQLSSWATRGWTYQETLISKVVEVYNSNWDKISTMTNPSYPMNHDDP